MQVGDAPREVGVAIVLGLSTTQVNAAECHRKGHVNTMDCG